MMILYILCVMSSCIIIIFFFGFVHHMEQKQLDELHIAVVKDEDGQL